MNVATLLKQYFSDARETATIDVFDAESIYIVYQRVVAALNTYLEIELGVLQAMSYCFYEVLDNVLIHSGRRIGTVITQYDADRNSLRILVADDGRGIRASLADNPVHSDISEAQALKLCVQDSVTDGKGMGFGLYSTSRLIQNAGIRFEIHSGEYKLSFSSGQMHINPADPWQGTIVFMELNTSTDLNPNDVLANRADAATEYNETFLDDSTIDKLW